jgi:outer membrane protein OmpA-like peptidoglycan-associated protein
MLGHVRKLIAQRSIGFALAAVVALATGCVSGPEYTGPNAGICAAVGAALGGGGGATYGTNHDKGHDIDSAVGYGVAGAVVAGTAGYFICKAFQKPVPPPPAPAPAPEPAPAPPPPPPQAQRIVLRGVQFDLDKADIRPDAAVILDEAASLLSANPGTQVAVGGHTDSSGSDAYNQSLSERRAASVRDYLASKGVDASRLSTAGFGESQPVADNATAEGRALNRRVELSVKE